MPGLTVLLDHIAGLRDAMGSSGPDPVAAAVLAQLAGADGIGYSLRGTLPMSVERDARLLRQTVHGRLVLHMTPLSEMVGLALDVKPERVVLMPAKQLDEPIGHGLVPVDTEALAETVDTLKANGISVSVCISPTPQQAKAARQIGADWVLLHTGGLKAATSVAVQTRELDNLVDTIKMARKLRLHTALGNGLDYQLVKLFKGVPEIDEFSMGQSVIARAVLIGMERAVGELVQVIRGLS